jgi:serine/threonine protein kinase
MRLVQHDRIGKLYCALQDTRNIYFVLELLQGGEFFTYLQKVGRLSEAKACFYAASVVSAYTSLHSLRIAYRDLKPENMVLDAKVHISSTSSSLSVNSLLVRDSSKSLTWVWPNKFKMERPGPCAGLQTTLPPKSFLTRDTTLLSTTGLW